MKRLLLASSSKTHGTGYLDHCEDWIRRLFDGIDRLLFVPYALHDRDLYAAQAADRLRQLGLAVDSIHQAPDPVAAVESAAGLFIGGGNTFRLLRELQVHGLVEPIRRRVAAGLPYMGTSAGSNVACPSIKTTNDMPIVAPEGFSALGLIGFQINPHYLDPDPRSTHQGETRDARLAEFLEESDLPVVALREGALLWIEGGAVTLAGDPGGKLFRRGAPPRDLAPGERIDPLVGGAR